MLTPQDIRNNFLEDQKKAEEWIDKKIMKSFSNGKAFFNLCDCPESFLKSDVLWPVLRKYVGVGWRVLVNDIEFYICDFPEILQKLEDKYAVDSLGRVELIDTTFLGDKMEIGLVPEGLRKHWYNL